MWEARATPDFIAGHHVQRQRMVCDGLFRQTEAVLRQRQTDGDDWGKGGEKRYSADYVRPNDVHDSLSSGFFIHIRAAKHSIECGFRHVDHRTDVF